MKWIPIILLIFTHSIYAQQVSRNIPVTNKRSDAGIEIITIGEEHIILASDFCHDSPNFNHCTSILRTNKYGDTAWIKTYDGSPDTNLFPIGRNLVYINDTIYVAATIRKGDHDDIRVMSFDQYGDMIQFRDFEFPNATALHVRGLIEAKGVLAFYGIYSRPGNTEAYITTIDRQLNHIEEYRYGDPGHFKRLMELSALEDGYVLAFSEDPDPYTYAHMIKLNDSFEEEYSRIEFMSRWEFEQVSIFGTEDKGYVLGWQKDVWDSHPDNYPSPCTIYKMDSLFNLEWEYSFFHQSSREQTSIKLTEKGEILGMGATDYFWGVDEYKHWLDPWCFLLDMDGNLIWDRAIMDTSVYGGRFWDGVDTEEGFTFVGDIDMKNPTGVPFLNDPDVWFLTLDENGCWNGNCNDYILITGDTTSITGTIDVTDTEDHFISYPNPTKDILTIVFPENQSWTGDRKIRISDITGKIITEYKIYAPKCTVNLSHLQDGTYLVSHLLEGRIIGSEKVVVHH